MCGPPTRLSNGSPHAPPQARAWVGCLPRPRPLFVCDRARACVEREAGATGIRPPPSDGATPSAPRVAGTSAASTPQVAVGDPRAVSRLPWTAIGSTAGTARGERSADPDCPIGTARASTRLIGSMGSGEKSLDWSPSRPACSASDNPIGAARVPGWPDENPIGASGGTLGAQQRSDAPWPGRSTSGRAPCRRRRRPSRPCAGWSPPRPLPRGPSR